MYNKICTQNTLISCVNQSNHVDSKTWGMLISRSQTTGCRENMVAPEEFFDIEIYVLMCLCANEHVFMCLRACVLNGKVAVTSNWSRGGTTTFLFFSFFLFNSQAKILFDTRAIVSIKMCGRHRDTVNCVTQIICYNKTIWQTNHLFSVTLCRTIGDIAYWINDIKSN